MRQDGKPDIFVSSRGGALALGQRAAPTDFVGSAGTTARRLARQQVHAQPAEEIDSLVVRLMALDLLLTVLLQRVYIGVSITLLTHLLVFVALFLSGRVRFSGLRIGLYWLFWGTATASLLVSGNSFSAPSLLLGLVCYATFTAVVPASRATYFAFIRVFQTVALCVAVLVLADVVLQLAGLGMPSMDAILPASLAPPTMNYLQSVSWGSSLLKPNAFFMMEASYASQFVALGLIFELSFFRRTWWLAAFAAALFLTFAGTGLLLVLLCLPLIARRFWRQTLLYGLVLVPLLGGLAVGTGWYDIAAKRLTTFDTRNSSANARFVAPFETIDDIMSSGDAHTIFFGYGAGKTSRDDYVPGLDTIEYNAVSAVLINYGFFATVAFLIFITTCLFSTGAALIVAFAVALDYHLMGGYLLLPPIVNYCYLLAAGWAIQPDREQAAAAPDGRIP